MLVFNVTKPPLNDVVVRRAIAYSINYQDISTLAVSGYSSQLQPGLILPFGTESRFFSKEDAQQYGALFDPAKAKKILADAGYKSVFVDGRLDHMLDAQGKNVPPIQIMSPSGWSDWEAIVRLAVRDMRAVGIDAREKFIDEGLYWTTQPSGEFDAMMHTPSAECYPSTLLARFEGVMTSRDWAPVGERMNENYGRYNQPGSPQYNSAVDSLINIIPLITDEAELVAAYRKLNVIFMQDQPAIPLVYRPEYFYQYSTKFWNNFPNEENPYAPPQVPTVQAARDMLWKLTKSR
jgi:peptide/nickel transport system substrate-binding protein